MPSATHEKMVLAIERLFLEKYQLGTSTEWCVTVDHNKERYSPESIGRYRPDFHAWSMTQKRNIVGEAKVVDDLRTKRSQKQIKTFIKWLAEQDRSSVFVLCVSLGWVPDARCLIRCCQYAKDITIHLIDQTGFEHLYANQY